MAWHQAFFLSAWQHSALKSVTGQVLKHSSLWLVAVASSTFIKHSSPWPVAVASSTVYSSNAPVSGRWPRFEPTPNQVSGRWPCCCKEAQGAEREREARHIPSPGVPLVAQEEYMEGGLGRRLKVLFRTALLAKPGSLIKQHPHP